jgi:hypothetical protein
MPRHRIAALLPWVLIPALGFAWFWFFRANGWNGGDSEQWEREITAGITWRKRQMLSFALMQASYQATHALWGWTAHLAINLTSCLAGAAALLILWRMLREGRAWGWPFAIAATAGFAALFHGHIETYAMPATALLLHLLAVQRVVQGRWPLWTLPATFGLFAWFHLVAFFAAPAVVWVLWHEWRRRRGGEGVMALRGVGWGALPALALPAMLMLPDVGYGEFVGSNFIAPPPELLARPWAVLTDVNVPTKLLFMVQNAGLAAPVALLVLWRVARWRRHRRDLMHLGAYLACFLGMTAIWRPDAGPLDWDLFSFPWIVAVVIVARAVMGLPARAWIVGALLGSNIQLLAWRPLPWAEVGNRGRATIELKLPADLPASTKFLLDDRQPLGPLNRHIRAGAHWIRVVGAPGGGEPMRAMWLEPGDRVVWSWDGRQLELERLTPGAP